MMNKRVANLIYYVLLGAALLLVFLRWWLASNNRLEEATLLRYIIFGMLIAAVLFRLGQRFFPRWFDNRPTREELEKKNT